VISRGLILFVYRECNEGRLSGALECVAQENGNLVVYKLGIHSRPRWLFCRRILWVLVGRFFQNNVQGILSFVRYRLRPIKGGYCC